ncbi:MAG: endospore germination permease [Clostridiaceae bacterium]|nr:endospore germination permease [Clostridiaceae bacterium]
MIKEGKFGVQEAICLTWITIVSKVFFSSPAVLARLIGSTGWYATLISAAVALLGFSFIYLLLKRFPDKGIVEIFDIAFGRVIGFIISCILGLYMLFITVARTSELSGFLRVYVAPQSPNWFIIGIFVVCIYTLSILGLESIARLSKLLIYPLLLGFLTVLLLGVQNYDFNNLFPAFGYGLDKIAYNGILRSSVYGEVIILAIFAKSFQGARFIKKEGIIGISLSAAIISLSLLCCSLTFPYYIEQEITSPMYELSTLIDYGRFVQRVEAIFLYVWIMSNFISATVVFYSFMSIFCYTFRIPDKKPIIIGSCIILYTVSLMHKNIISIILGYISIIRNFGSLPLFVLPLITLIAVMIRKKGENTNA